jgi:hypothetical protein
VRQLGRVSLQAWRGGGAASTWLACGPAKAAVWSREGSTRASALARSTWTQAVRWSMRLKGGEFYVYAIKKDCTDLCAIKKVSRTCVPSC